MDFREYLVSYGNTAYFGRFVPQTPLDCQRGDRVIVRTYRGLEIGTVLCEATAGHARLLGERATGPLMRLATAEDQLRSVEWNSAKSRAYSTARFLADDLQLPIEIVDIETIVEPRTLVVHFLRLGEVDYRPLVSKLSREFDAHIEMLDLASIAPGSIEEQEPLVESTACGSCGSGGCGSCGEGGGQCGSGGCGSCSTAPSVAKPPDQLAELRFKLPSRSMFPV